MKSLVIAAVAMMSVGCTASHYMDECNNVGRVGSDVTFREPTALTVEERASFNRAADDWHTWTGGKLTVSLASDGKYALTAVREPASLASFDAAYNRLGIGSAAVDRPIAMTWDNQSGISFVPSRMSTDIMSHVFAHEIGHVIGLNHVYEKGSIMYPQADSGESFTESDSAMMKMCYLDKQVTK